MLLFSSCCNFFFSSLVGSGGELGLIRNSVQALEPPASVQSRVGSSEVTSAHDLAQG